MQILIIGTLERCLNSLENAKEGTQASNALKQILNAAYQVSLLFYSCIQKYFFYQ